MKPKTLHKGEWVVAMPFMNKNFPVVDGACRYCRRASCAPSYINIYTAEVVCKRCWKTHADSS